MSIGRRPALDAGGCRFESYHSDQNNMALVLMVARWIPNPKVRVRIFQAMPKLEVQFAASGETGRRKRLKIS